jgi:cell division protein FtsW
VDPLFLVVVLGLVCFGLVMLLSASMFEGLSNDENPLFFFTKQLLFTLLGGAVCIFIGIQNLRRLDRPGLAIFLYIICLGMLSLVLVPGIGVVAGGARRWFALGGIQVQPTEVVKFLLVFCLASYYSWLERRRSKGWLDRRTGFRSLSARTFYEFLLPVVLLVPLLILIAMEPHVSGIMIFVLLTGAVICLSGARASSIVAGVAILLLIALLLGMLVMALLPVLPESVQKYTNLEYVGERLETFFHPEAADDAQSWQPRQALQAIGAGGLTGVGLGMGRQKYGYLPMSYNDYIFAIIGEELGFIGAIAVLLLFLLLLVRGIILARRAPSTFGSVLAAGYTILLAVQALLNIGVATNSIPPTGISLPFFSYGGSSNIIFLASVGMVLSVSRTQRSSSSSSPKGVRP